MTEVVALSIDSAAAPTGTSVALTGTADIATFDYGELTTEEQASLRRTAADIKRLSRGTNNALISSALGCSRLKPSLAMASLAHGLRRN